MLPPRSLLTHCREAGRAQVRREQRPRGRCTHSLHTEAQGQGCGAGTELGLDSLTFACVNSSGWYVWVCTCTPAHTDILGHLSQGMCVHMLECVPVCVRTRVPRSGCALCVYMRVLMCVRARPSVSWGAVCTQVWVHVPTCSCAYPEGGCTYMTRLRVDIYTFRYVCVRPGVCVSIHLGVCARPGM